jgi:hypothetical protein
MNIFETKSKYFSNNNSKFAKMFSTASISLVLILVGIVSTAMFVHECFQNSAEAKLVRNTKKWLTDYGFTYKGLTFNSVVDEDKGTYKNVLRYEFTVSEIQHKQLNDGKKVLELEDKVVFLIVSAKYEDLAIQNIGLTWWGPKHYEGWINKYSFDDWFHYMGTPTSAMPVLSDSYNQDDVNKYKAIEPDYKELPYFNSAAPDSAAKKIDTVPVVEKKQDSVETPASSTKGIDGFMKDLNDTASIKNMKDTQEEKIIIPSNEPKWNT